MELRDILSHKDWQQYQRERKQSLPIFIPYKEYIQTDAWGLLKGRSLAANGLRCICCEGTDRLDGHHLFYRKNLFDSTVDEIVPLCRKCHDKLHYAVRGQDINKVKHTKEDVKRIVKQFDFKQPPKEGYKRKFPEPKHHIIVKPDKTPFFEWGKKKNSTSTPRPDTNITEVYRSSNFTGFDERVNKIKRYIERNELSVSVSGHYLNGECYISASYNRRSTDIDAVKRYVGLGFPED